MLLRYTKNKANKKPTIHSAFAEQNVYDVSGMSKTFWH